MGRYYRGDIKGKFFFAVQPSTAAERFGGYAQKPQIVNYYFDKDNLEQIKSELRTIETALGTFLKELKTFFKENETYDDKMLIKAGFPEKKLRYILKDYADYILGMKIKKCVEKKGLCEFEAEL